MRVIRDHRQHYPIIIPEYDYEEHELNKLEFGDIVHIEKLTTPDVVFYGVDEEEDHTSNVGEK